MIAKVIVNIPNSNVDQLFDYIVPFQFSEFAKVGSRVKVPFGDANRQIMGFILEITTKSTYEGNIKEITEVIDYEPILTEEQLKISTFIKEDAICPLSRILNLMIPDALQLKTKKYLTAVDISSLDARLAILFHSNQTIEYKTTLKEYDNSIAREVKKGNIIVSYQAIQVVKDKMVTKYQLDKKVTSLSMTSLKSENQRAFLDKIKGDIPRTSSELMEMYDISVASIVTLTKKGFLTKMVEKASRIKVRNIPVEKRIRKTDDTTINKLLNNLVAYTKPILYMPNDENQLLEAILQVINMNQKEGKNTIILVPNILASYKIENIIRKNTLLSVALINSNLSEGEILDYYNEIKNDTYTVVVTTAKGALFPYQRVGTYFLLNSENDNYYNSQSPRYDLHQVIEFASCINHAKVVRVSYAPTVLEYTYALKGHLDIIEDFKKTNQDVTTEIIDLKKELQIGNNSSLSSKLLKKIQINQAKGKKSLLILNNPSYSSYVICRSCGNVIKCPRCNTSFQYSRKNNQLVCPSCNYRELFENKCPTCASDQLKFGGIGIEQVEEDLKEYLPSFKIASLATNHFDTYCSIESDFEDGDIDILIVTVTTAQSILGKNIGLIAFVNIDAIAKSTDFDATYRAYSALKAAEMKLTPMSDAQIVVQTYNPMDDYLKDFIVGDYHDYIKHELSIRKILRNEPFYYINRILVKGKYEEIFQEAYKIKQLLQTNYEKAIFILGPTYNYQYASAQLIVKHKIADISTYYQKIYQGYQSSSVMVFFDKYPKNI